MGKLLLETGDGIILEDASGDLLLEDEASGVVFQVPALAGAGDVNYHARVSQLAVETLSKPSTTPIRVSQLAIEVIGSSNAGTITFGGPALDGTGTFVAAPGNVTFRVPAMSGSGGNVTLGSGNVTFGAPQLDSGFVRITQQARLVVVDETDPTVRLTQMGREVGHTETNPGVRITQMARQVLYNYVCASEPPPTPIDVGVVHILRRALQPLWKLERFDQKVRTEDGVEIPSIPGVPPSWNADGHRWKLERFDIEWTRQGDNAGDGPGNVNKDFLLLETGGHLLTQFSGKIILERDNGPWRLERFDLEWSPEETS